MDILSDLNEKQREAVTTTNGPVLVIAGAGSGKTRALTHRIAYLIKELGVPASNILAVTFTNKAAGEMRDRVNRLLGEQPPEEGQSHFRNPSLPTIGTFHSVCARILRKHIHLLDFENQFAIYDDSDQLIMMKHLLEDLKISEKELNPRAVLAHISNAKNRLITPKEFMSTANSYFAEKVGRLYAPYQERLKKNNALDFDDLLMKTIELFKTHRPILEQYQEKFKFIHVDEYQDTNHAQYVLTNLLAAKYRNLCVIGDHDQSIYSWRGADLTNILDFEKDYPEAKVIKMEQNYRSSRAILDTAQAVIQRNRRRKDKKLWTERTGGEKTRVWIAENERHEAELVAEEIRKTLKGYEFQDYRDFVILYRTNAQSRTLEEVFMRYAIPYKIVGGIKFYSRKEIKDIVAYLKVIANPADSVSLLRIVNVPQRQIGPKTLEKLQTFANIKDCTLFEAMRRVNEIDCGPEAGVTLDNVRLSSSLPRACRGEALSKDDIEAPSSGLPDAKREKVANFAKLIRRLQKQNHEVRAAALIKFLIDESGYKKYLDDGSVEGEARLENVAELISVAAKYNKLEPGISLNVFLEEIALISDLDNLEEKENAVTFMTLHSAKGLEFPNVFICGLEEGLLPHSRSLLSPEELEEERRLFYVGCTRAMERLFLLHTKSRMFYGETRDVIPSQFLADIPEELTEKNAKIEFHPTAAFLGRGRRRSTTLGPIGNRPIPTENVHGRANAFGSQTSSAGRTGAAGFAAQQFSDGDRVMHRTFGEGIVINAAGGVVTVAFKDPKVGIKKLAISIAPLEKI